MLLYASCRSMYLPTTAILTCFFGLTTRSTNLRQFVRSGGGVFDLEKIADEHRPGLPRAT